MTPIPQWMEHWVFGKVENTPELHRVLGQIQTEAYQQGLSDMKKEALDALRMATTDRSKDKRSL